MAAFFSDDSGNGRNSGSAQKPDAGGIGELLKGARERRGLTLEQVSRETRIPQRHLEAIEHDNLAALPGPFYQRAQILTYARAVNLDPNLVLARLERRPAPSVVPNVSLKPPTVHKGTRSRTHRALIASGFVLTAIVFWRAIPWNPPVDGHREGRGVADSTNPIAPAPGTAETPAAVAIHQTDDQIPQPSASTGSVLPARIDSAEAQPAVVEKPELPIPTTQADERASVGFASELVVTTEPAGAWVTVDGIGWGVTPVTIRYLPPGNKRIRVSKDGYAAIERVVGVVEGRRTTADIQLSNEP